MIACFICGNNHDFRISEQSNNKNKYGERCIFPAISLKLDASQILSFSTNYHSVAVTTDGVAYGIGKNVYGEISWTLPHKELSHFTEIELRDGDGCRCSAKSAVCGNSYTLYLISPASENGRNQLAYSYSNMKTEFPTVLNIGEVNPISLFGGRYFCAAIDAEGSIIFIHEPHHESTNIKTQRVFLPFNEKAVIVTCCDGFVVSLSSNGRVFKSKSYITPSFEEVSELKGTEIHSISGFYHHCFAVSKDGRVFVCGESDRWSKGCLGLGENTSKVIQFTEIPSLRKYKICEAYAGNSHSLFQTREGKILACGTNENGELLLSSGPSKENIYEPVETTVTDASFCIAGSLTTTVFKNYEPPMNPNKGIQQEKVTETKKSIPASKAETSTSTESTETEISRLKSEIENLEKQLSSKDIEIKRQKTELDKQKSLLAEQKEEIDRLKKEGKAVSEKSGSEMIEILDLSALESFKRLEEISFGSSGKVFKVVKEIIYALKEMKTNASPEEFKQFLQEYELLCRFDHPNIVKAFGIFLSDETHPPSIVLEFCQTNLEGWVKEGKHSKVETVIFVYEIVEGMKYVHPQKVIHRDLKPRNILIGKDGHIKISDFGISKLMSSEDQSMTGGVGTQRFMAPEIIDESDIYDEKVDVYSFGVVLFFILTGGELPKIKISEILRGKKAPIPTKISDITRDLINKCWNFESKDRPSFTEINEYIESKDFNLIELSDSEIYEVKEKVKLHKKLIPSY
ncbi:hypothetical protein M9Y10_015935 [Tritrichomonas musculus]|uniref:mitogen-activated protein kinase kinase n=1 Tax=Tritrichomonas musculus TaxID=1915356 RepID=A0ABR2I6K4_9EUKA